MEAVLRAFWRDPIFQFDGGRTFFNKFLTDPRANSLSPFSDEYRAYETSAWAAGALWQYHGAQGTGTFTLKGEDGSSVIWNSSWAAVDDKAITQFITHNYHFSNGKPYKETTPHDPWQQEQK